MSTFDVVVAGGGVNGLACAATLAREGLSVCVVERNAWVGGGAVTQEVTLPGFKHDLYGSSHVWIQCNADFKAIQPELERYGLKYLSPDGSDHGPSRPPRRPGHRHLPLDRQDVRQHRAVLEGRRDLLSSRSRRFRAGEGRLPEGVLLAALAAFDDGARARSEPRGSEAAAGVLAVGARVGRDELRERLRQGGDAQLGAGAADPSRAGRRRPVLLHHDPGDPRLRPGNTRRAAARSCRTRWRAMSRRTAARCSPAARSQKSLVDDNQARGVRLDDGRTLTARRAVVSALEPRQTFLRARRGAQAGA